MAQLKQSIFKIRGTKFSEHLNMPLDVLRNPVFNSSVIFYLRILHLLRILFSLGCKVFISAGPRMQWYCRLIMKNSALDKFAVGTH